MKNPILKYLYNLVFESENEKLKGAIDRLENQSRRNNLVLHGIEETETETWEECEQKVGDELQEKLGIHTDDILVERAHRLVIRSRWPRWAKRYAARNAESRCWLVR